MMSANFTAKASFATPISFSTIELDPENETGG